MALTAFCSGLAIPNVPETSVHDYTGIAHVDTPLRHHREARGVGHPASAEPGACQVREGAGAILGVGDYSLVSGLAKSTRFSPLPQNLAVAGSS